MRSTEISRASAAVAGGALLVPVITMLFFVPFYQTNDDVAMRLLAEGSFVPGSGPLALLMHMNVIVGAVMRAMYTLIPPLPWYDIVLGASLTAASAGFLCIWLDTRKWYDVAWSAIFSLFFLVPAFVNVQFSVVGLGCAGAGTALLVRAIAVPLDERPFRFHVLFGASLVVWGSLVRSEGAALMLLDGGVLALPFIIAALRNADTRLRFRRVVLAGVAAIAVAALAIGLNQAVYKRAHGWEDFHRYNFLRTRISEYLSADRITPEVVAELPKQVGWTQNDFNMFRNWFFTDPNLFSLARVQRAERLLFSAAGQPAETAPVRPPIREMLTPYAKDLLPVFLLLALFAVSWRRGLLVLLYLAFALATMGGLIVLMMYTAKAPPERIIWPMVMLIAAMLPLAAQRWGRAPQPLVAAIALIAAACVAASSLLELRATNQQRQAAAAVAMEDAEALRQSGATFFIIHGNAFAYEDFWRPLHVEKTPFPFLGLGVSARTPPVQDFLKRTGRTDLPLSICSEPKTLVVARRDLPPLLTKFALEHHHRAVKYVPLFERKRFTAWKCEPASPEQTGDHHP
jgi:hypothetical protein